MLAGEHSDTYTGTTLDTIPGLGGGGGGGQREWEDSVNVEGKDTYTNIVQNTIPGSEREKGGGGAIALKDAEV